MCSGIAILDSSMVEHSAVNRGVVGSSPTRGALVEAPTQTGAGAFIISLKRYGPATVAKLNHRVNARFR